MRRFLSKIQVEAVHAVAVSVVDAPAEALDYHHTEICIRCSGGVLNHGVVGLADGLYGDGQALT